MEAKRGGAKRSEDVGVLEAKFLGGGVEYLKIFINEFILYKENKCRIGGAGQCLSHVGGVSQMGAKNLYRRRRSFFVGSKVFGNLV